MSLLEAAAAADGVDPVSEPVLLRLRHGRPGRHLLARDATGALVGFADLDVRHERATTELTVHPAHRGHGTGTALVDAVAQRAGSALWAWAHGEHPAAVRLADRAGMRRARELWQLRRSLTDPVPSRLLPEGLSLRAFVPGSDERAVVEVNNRAFAWHPEQSGWEVEDLQLRGGEPWFDPAGFLLAVDGADRLHGFHWTKVHPGPPPAGEVYVLAVDPDAQSGGLGAALTAAGLEHLRERGLPEALLYSEADNAAAIRMYRKLGFTHHHTDVEFLR
ncbi:MAG: mycothiol synthase [Pseudonocardiaceae bacterium]|nr:mycothiol synthase [Pseudonocardiaceae bacterium]